MYSYGEVFGIYSWFDFQGFVFSYYNFVYVGDVLFCQAFCCRNDEWCFDFYDFVFVFDVVCDCSCVVVYVYMRSIGNKRYVE